MLVYKFGPYLISRNSAVLKRDGVTIPLTRRRHSMLILLLENAGNVVTKDQIIDSIWHGLAIGESNLSQLIYATRKLLGDTAQDQHFIETVPGIGYRFRIDVELIEVDEEDEPSTVDPPSNTSRRNGVATQILRLGKMLRSPYAVILGIALLLVFVVTLLVLRGVRPKFAGRSEFSGRTIPASNIPNNAPVLSLPGIENSPAFSNDGRYICFSWNEDQGSNHDIFFVDLTEGALRKARRVTEHPGHNIQPVWSPDGREIAFLRLPAVAEERFHLIIVSMGDGTEREVGRVWGGLDWSPDGQFFAVSESDHPGKSTGISLISRDGKVRLPLSRPTADLNTFDSTPRFSPDGQSIAFLRWVNDHSADLHVVDISSGRTIQLTSDGRSIGDLQWNPNGEEIIFVSNRGGSKQLWKVPSGGGEPKTVVNVPPDIDHFDISSRTFQLAYSRSVQDMDIRVRPIPTAAGSSEPPCTIRSSSIEHSPNFSPDGRHLSFESDRLGTAEIWISRNDCSEPVPLTSFNLPGLGSSRWSPDGEEIIFNLAKDEKPQIYSLRTDRSNLRQLTTEWANNILPSFSHNGRWVFFSSDRMGKYDIWRLPSSGGEATRITVGGGMSPLASADGRYLFYTRNELLRRFDLRSYTDEPISELSRIKVKRYWDQAGDNIYFASLNSGQRQAIYRLNLKTRQIEQLFEIEGALPITVPGLSVSRDEKHIAYCFISYSESNIIILNDFRSH